MKQKCHWTSPQLPPHLHLLLLSHMGCFFYKVYTDKTTHALSITPSYIFKHPLVRHASQQAR